jgi:hypothetical protein
MGMSPVGTVEELELRGPYDLIPQVWFVVFHAVLFEKLQILFLKRFLAMVRFLAVDVGDGFGHDAGLSQPSLRDWKIGRWKPGDKSPGYYHRPPPGTWSMVIIAALP